jgi:glycosyltransferase involved in cell wall biosynthesis
MAVETMRHIVARGDARGQRARPLRIGLDVSWTEGTPTGTGMYTLELVRALLARDHENTYYLYFKDPIARGSALWELDAPNAVKRVVGIRSTTVRNQALAYWLYRDRIDLFHSTGFFLPYAWLGKKVVSILDVNYLRGMRDWLSVGAWGPFLSLLVQTPLSAHASRAVVTLSEFAKQDILHYLRVRSDKVHVIYPSIRTSLTQTPPTGRLEGVLSGLERDRYILFVGTVTAQKNVERLIEAFAGVLDRWRRERGAGEALRLVLAGRSYGSYVKDTLRPLCQRLGCEDQVLFTGYVSDQDIRTLYAGARCVAVVSKEEGFGLPIVEAMTCGAPVVTSTTSSMPEVAGNAALTVDPADTAAICHALAELCLNDALRQELRRRGFARARQFSSEQAAEALLGLYQRVATSRRPAG